MWCKTATCCSSNSIPDTGTGYRQNPYLWREANCKPHLPSEKAEDFTMVDMLRFVDEINPLGD